MTYEYLIPFTHLQFYLGDDNLDWDPSEVWTKPACRRHFAWMPEAIGLGTVREAGYVLVNIEIAESRPTIHAAEWDQIVECSIRVPSGRLFLTSPEGSSTKPITVTPGTYRVLALFGNFLAMSEKLHEADPNKFARMIAGRTRTKKDLKQFEHFRLLLWPDRRQKLIFHKRATWPSAKKGK